MRHPEAVANVLHVQKTSCLSVSPPNNLPVLQSSLADGLYANEVGSKLWNVVNISDELTAVT
jgi:hypothetical protein